MLEITIEGHPYVKKSNQHLQRRGRRQVLVNTPVYNRWHSDALDQLEEMGYDVAFKRKNKKLHELGQPLLKAQINEPINLQCKFFMPTNGRVDLSALYEGIQDVLVEVGVLHDDNWRIVASHDGSGVWKDAARPRIEVSITPKQAS